MGPGKISTPGCGPLVPPDLYSTEEGLASWFPLVPSDWGIWASTPDTDQDSCPWWLPPVPLDLVSPKEDFSAGPLTPRFKRFSATRILPITFCVCSAWYPANWKSLLIQNYWNFDLECKHNKHETTFRARKVTPVSPRIKVTREFRETDPWCDCRRRWTQLTVFCAMSCIPLTFIQFKFS